MLEGWVSILSRSKHVKLVFGVLICTGSIPAFILIFSANRSTWTTFHGIQSVGEFEEFEDQFFYLNVQNLTLNSSDANDRLKLGEVNCDIWHWIVGYLVDDMRIIREFPSYPDVKKKVKHLYNEFSEVDPADVKGRYGHKMYGYLIPPEPGSYKFKVELTSLTAAVSVELWISPSTDPHSATRVLDTTHNRLNMNRKVKHSTLKIAESAEVSLMSEAHYFEFLEKAYSGKVVANVKWKTPSSDSYVSIPRKNIASSENHTMEQPLLEVPLLPSSELQEHHRVQPIWSAIRPNLRVLPACYFKAIYAQPREVNHYTGYRQVHQTRVHPADETSFKNRRKKLKGNPVIESETVDKVVELYSEALGVYKYGKHAELAKLHYLEETTNKEDGSRFLLEMDVRLNSTKELVHTSEYVYLKKNSSHLCRTTNFQWTKNVDVYFVVSVKNLGLWVKHLIYNMEDIYAATKDEHFSLIIVDYKSEDMNIREEARKSSFKRIDVINMDGQFSRSSGLQTGVDYVANVSSIVMTIDMHLTLPLGIVEYVRKHTVQYKMAFTPTFFRLQPGYTEINYNGFWEMLTYGLFAMYKSDWIKSDGFSTEKYLYKWGGEDWDLLDKALSTGFEAFRIRPPGLVHYHHTRKGMWGNSEVKLTEKWILHH